jgi:hypothetical protein
VPKRAVSVQNFCNFVSLGHSELRQGFALHVGRLLFVTSWLSQAVLSPLL